MEGQTASRPVQLPDRTVEPRSFLRPTPPTTGPRNGHLSLHTFSPVNENGSFEFDRVLKTGKVLRRVKNKHAFRASWKPAYLVLRPNLLSVYKDEEATRLRASITLSEVTAVASVKSPRSTRQFVFGIFTPSKNYRFEAASERDAEDWIGRIRAETRIDEDDEALLATLSRPRDVPQRPRLPIDDTTDHSDVEQTGSGSSPDAGRMLSPPQGAKRLPCSQDYSGNEITSYSDWSDGPGSSSLPQSAPSNGLSSIRSPADKSVTLPRDTSRASELGVLRDPERVVCQGYLQCLRIKGGVRQWSRLWVVLRPKSLGFYKDEQEYAAVKVIPMLQVIDAAEIDPISRSKNYCLQIIAEDKSYRLCAPDEESLAKWLGSLKSIFVARKKLVPSPATSAPSPGPAAATTTRGTLVH